MPFIDHLRRRAWIPFAALVLALLLAQVPLVVQLERLVGDMQRGLVAGERFFGDAVFVDIDEASLRKMKPYLGEWPYERDTYALALDYLNEQGAKTVVFDILLSEARAGDEVFARALRKHGNGVLIAAAPAGGIAMTAAERARLKALGWRLPPAAGLRPAAWPSFLLPNATLLDGAPDTAVGVAAAVADADGVLRRLPLLHEAEGGVLPVLPLAAIGSRASDRSRFSAQGAREGMASVDWPVDGDGFVHLYFPGNANAVLSMPFSEVAEAALGLVGLADAPGFFEGKTVFIGSTAMLADRVMTPLGAMSGTYALAIAHQTLANGLAWRPPSTAWNALLDGAAVAALVGLFLPFARSWRGSVAWAAGSAALVYGSHLGLLVVARQQTALLTPLLVLASGWAIHGACEQRRLRRRARRLEVEADQDSLTGLPVRRAFLRVLRQEAEESSRKRRPLSVAIIDIDHFKQVNDTYGHAVGDIVIKTFAQVVQRCLRASDSVARWGGEEFVVLLPDTDMTGAAVVLDKVRLAIGEERFPAPAQALKVTVSAGVAQYGSREPTPEDILAVADRALYEAKRSGRNRVCVNC